MKKLLALLLLCTLLLSLSACADPVIGEAPAEAPISADSAQAPEKLWNPAALSPRPAGRRKDAAAPGAVRKPTQADLEERLRKLDRGFSETLLDLIDASGEKDSAVYKRANVDRKLFSKIKNKPDYRPTKPTALAFAFALKLDLEQTKDLLAKAGHALSHSNRFDVIVEYFLLRREYDLFRVNEVLFAFDQPLIGA